MGELNEQEYGYHQQILDLGVRGEEPSDALVDDWGEHRQQRADELRSLSLEKAQRVLGGELQAIEAALAKLEDEVGADRTETFRLGVEIGLRLRWVLWLADLLSQELTMDPLALVEEELTRVEQRALNVTRLDSRLASEAVDVLSQSRKEQLQLLRCRLRRFVQVKPEALAAGPLDEAIRRWIAANEAFQIESDGATEVGKLDAFFSLQGDSGLADLRSRRKEHLLQCKASLEACTPDEVSEFISSSLSDLLDRISGGLSDGDNSVGIEVRLEVLRLMGERLDAFETVIGDRRAEILRKGILAQEDRRRVKQSVSQLKRASRQVFNARKEVHVQHRVESTFGVRNVRRFESFIMVLIVGLLGLVWFEWRLPTDLPGWLIVGDSVFEGIVADLVVERALQGFHYLDLFFCIFFQIDFFVRWAFAGWGLSYFYRHFFIESLPALPYGLFMHHLGAADGSRALIAFRVFRLRGATLRAIFLVGIRIFRVAVFFMRGVDRACEKFKGVLDRDIVVFDADPIGESSESPIRRRVFALESQRQRLIRSFYDDLDWESRLGYLKQQAILLGTETRLCTRLDLPYRRSHSGSRGEIRVERVISTFIDCDVTRVIGMVGKDGVDRIARWLRYLDVPGFRSAPVIRRLVSSARRSNAAEAVSRAVNSVGQVLQEMLSAVRFWADLSGITTGPQILDRIGTALVTASKRPAVRLILFGGLFLLVQSVVEILQWRGGVLDSVTVTLSKFVGIPILVLGSICLVILITGRWFKRIAGEALDHYLRTSDAQFYPLIKARKFLRFEEDVQLIFRSVFASECELRMPDCEDIDEEEWLDFLAAPMRKRAQFMPGKSPVQREHFEAFAQDREIACFLYRDFLDSPILHRSDDKASTQLLGNLDVQSVRFRTLGVDGKERKRLEKLSLDRGSILSFGPYFWFRFITESLSIEMAKLIQEYNAICIPKDRLPLARARDRKRFAEFLEERLGGVDRNRSIRARYTKVSHAENDYSSASFTAFDFLGPTEESDRVVVERYGQEVLDALRRDRRAVVRDIFGTRPYHLLPRHRRVLNPYRLYHRFLGGAKFFFLPFLMLAAVFRVNIAAFAQIRELVEEVLGKTRRRRSTLSRFATFDVAVRKINRMRKPLFMEALRLRAAIDVSYLGLRVPGQPRRLDSLTFHEDLDFIGASDAERRPLTKLYDRAVKDLRRFRLYLADNGWSDEGLDDLLLELDPSGQLKTHREEVLRALVTAYVTDHNSLRTMLTSREWTRRFFEKVLRQESRSIAEVVGESIAVALSLIVPKYRRRRRMFREYLQLNSNLEGLEPRVKRRVFGRLLRSDPFTERMLEFALRRLREDAEVGDDAVRDSLKRAACDYKLWTQKLISVRTIQTLTVLDVRNYRDMVWDVGEYAADETVEA